MTQTIDQLIDDLIAREGGFSDDPSDRGGRTNWGITEAVARAAGYRGDMRDLPRATAVAIYRQQYWTGPGFDRLAALDPALAAKCFDIGVNRGPGVAVRYLQRALNVLNGAGEYPDLKVDGGLGRLTEAALRAFLAKRGDDGRAVLMAMVRGLQAVDYISIAEGDPSQKKWLYGWIRARVLL